MSSSAVSTIFLESSDKGIPYCVLLSLSLGDFYYTPSTECVDKLRQPSPFQKPGESMTVFCEDDRANFGATLASTSSATSGWYFDSLFAPISLVSFRLPLFRGFCLLARISSAVC